MALSRLVFARLARLSSLPALLLVAGPAGAVGAAATASGPALPVLPRFDARAGTTMTLRAQMRPDGTQSFVYNGARIPPVLRAFPGASIRIRYVNALPAQSTEMCALGPCTNMTNLHFHGLGVSPDVGQDDVLTMIAMPGQTLRYDVHIPAGAPPGLNWYHTHPHGESDREVLDGMSGALVIEGIDRYAPAVRTLPERILVLRTTVHDDPDSITFTVNGAVRPTIGIAPGQRQFWRIVNASADTYADLAIDATPLEVIAVDGMPLAYHDPAHRSRVFRHVLLAPAGRVEAIVTGPPANAHAAMRTLGVNSGPDGDPMPAQVLADLSPTAFGAMPPAVPAVYVAPVFRPTHLAAVMSSKPSFVAVFTEGDHKFLINGQLFAMNSAPMATVRVGTYAHWRVVNKTNEIHPFHIHQVHFFAYAANGKPIAAPVWRDTVDVPLHSSIDVVLDATNPVIRGMSVFHCHILSHEDKGMMAKVLFE